MDVSVIIPTLEDDPVTVESLPPGIETVVVSEGNRSEARNIGVDRTTGDILVFCDDDIKFDRSYFWEQIGRSERGWVVGLEDFDFGFLLTRFLIVYRDDFERLGGFDEKLNHMEDTEFCLRARKDGMKLKTLPRDDITHISHESIGQGAWTTIKNTAYLSFRYPRFATNLWRGLLADS